MGLMGLLGAEADAPMFAMRPRCRNPKAELCQDGWLGARDVCSYAEDGEYSVLPPADGSRAPAAFGLSGRKV